MGLPTASPEHSPQFQSRQSKGGAFSQFKVGFEPWIELRLELCAPSCVCPHQLELPASEGAGIANCLPNKDVVYRGPRRAFEGSLPQYYTGLRADESRRA